MSFTFKPAKRENVGLLIGLVGPSGSGKTYSALELATGIAGGQKFCLIDTEAGRGLHYADQFEFDHGDFAPPFSPQRYTEAILAADKAGYPVIVVDSVSHVWAGEGGVKEMQEAKFQQLGGRDAVKMLSWAEPKIENKKMMSRLLRVRSHLILCFRAEEKTKMLANDKGKMVPTNIGWQPICEKNLPYELTASLLLSPDRPGVPEPIKLQEQHRGLFRPGELISSASGAHIRDWAKGGVPCSIDDVLREIEQAVDMIQLEAVGASIPSKRLGRTDLGHAKAAYKARGNELNAPTKHNPATGEVCVVDECENDPVEGRVYCEGHS